MGDFDSFGDFGDLAGFVDFSAFDAFGGWGNLGNVRVRRTACGRTGARRLTTAPGLAHRSSSCTDRSKAP